MQAGFKIEASGIGISRNLKILECIPPSSKPATCVAPTSNIYFFLLKVPAQPPDCVCA